MRYPSALISKIGNEYKIIGIPVCVKTSQTALCVEANSITPYTAKGKKKPCILYMSVHLFSKQCCLPLC